MPYRRMTERSVSAIVLCCASTVALLHLRFLFNLEAPMADRQGRGPPLVGGVHNEGWARTRRAGEAWLFVRCSLVDWADCEQQTKGK